MKTIVRITLASVALTLFATGCTDPKAEKRTRIQQIPWDLLRKESKLDSETLTRNTFHRSDMSDEEYEQLKTEVEPHRKELARYH